MKKDTERGCSSSTPSGSTRRGPTVEVPLFPWAWWDMAFQETSTSPLVLTWLSPLRSPSQPTSADFSQINSHFAYGKTEHPEADLRPHPDCSRLRPRFQTPPTGPGPVCPTGPSGLLAFVVCQALDFKFPLKPRAKPNPKNIHVSLNENTLGSHVCIFGPQLVESLGKD